MFTYRSLRLSSSFSTFGLRFSPRSSVSFNVFGVFTTLSSEFESNRVVAMCILTFGTDSNTSSLWSQWAFRGACRATTCSSPSTRATRCTGICEKTGDCCGTSSEESTSCCGKKWRGDRSICSLSGTIITWRSCLTWFCGGSGFFDCP